MFTCPACESRGCLVPRTVCVSSTWELQGRREGHGAADGPSNPHVIPSNPRPGAPCLLYA